MSFVNHYSTIVELVNFDVYPELLFYYKIRWFPFCIFLFFPPSRFERVHAEFANFIFWSSQSCESWQYCLFVFSSLFGVCGSWKLILSILVVYCGLAASVSPLSNFSKCHFLDLLVVFNFLHVYHFAPAASRVPPFFFSNLYIFCLNLFCIFIF